MAASGKPTTGKNGTMIVTNVTGETPTYSLSLDIKDMSHEKTAEIVKGSRLAGEPHKDTGDVDTTGKFIVYVAKSGAGAALPFDAGDHFACSGTYGGNPFAGTDLACKKRGVPQVARGEFCTVEIEWEATAGAFTDTPQLITVA